MNILVTVLSFIVTVAVLVVIHELGHYAAARFAGVKILRFSVGFGRTLWSKRVGPDQTEWAVSAVPLGGYVKMLDEREGAVDAAELPRAFGQRPLYQRALIVGAGPVANLVLAIALYGFVQWYGVDMIGGAAMIQGHIEIADGVTVSASTMVMHSLRKKGVYTAIFPVDEHASWEKNAVTLRNLYALRERVRALEKAQKKE